MIIVFIKRGHLIVKTLNKAKIYNAVTVTCVILCMLLIGRVAADELFGRRPEEHEPPKVRSSDPAGERGDGCVLRLEEEDIESRLTQYLPADIEIRDIDAEIGKDGMISISAVVSKSRFVKLLGSVELPRAVRLALGLMPGEARVSVSVLCSCDSESRLLAVAPISFGVGDSAFEASDIPQGLTDMTGDALNKLLLAAGVEFTGIAFEDGAIILTA